MSFLSLRNMAAGLIGSAAVVGATLPEVAQAQEGPPPTVTGPVDNFIPPSTSPLAPHFANLTETHAVPLSVVWEAFDRGVNTTPCPIRSNGFKDEPNRLAPFVHPGYQFDLVVDAARSIGIEATRPLNETYDRLYWPYYFGMLAFLFATFIIPEYSKKPLDIGNTQLRDNLTGAAAFLLTAGFLHSFSYTAIELWRDGPALSDLRFNSAAHLASFLSMSLFSFFHLWSLAQKLTFRLPGPAMYHIFLRDRTRHEPFILTGGRFLEATGTNVAELYAQAQVRAETAARALAKAQDRDEDEATQTARGKITATIEAGHLLKPDVQAAIAELPDDLETSLAMTLTSGDFSTFLADLRREPRDAVTTDVITQNLVTGRYISTSGARNKPRPRPGGLATPAVATVARRQFVINAESQLRRTPATKALIDEGKVVVRGTGRKTVLVLKADMEVKADDEFYVIEGNITETKPLPLTTNRWTISHRYSNARFKVTVKGKAKELLPRFGRTTAHRPFAKSLTLKSGLARVFNLIPARAKGVLRLLAPTAVTISLDRPAGTSQRVQNAIAAIVGPQRYVVRPVRPLIPVNRIGLESVVAAKQEQGRANATQVTLAIPRNVFLRHQDQFIGWLGVITGRETDGDYPYMVYVDVELNTLIAALGAETSGGSAQQGSQGWGQADEQKELFSKLIRDKIILLAVPTQLTSPSDVAFLTGHEKDAIKRPVGDMTRRDTVLHPLEPLGFFQSVRDFVRIFGRAGRLGFRFGRLRALGAITLTGGTIAFPLVATTKKLTGYTDPATYMTSGFRGYASGFFNAIASPSWMAVLGKLRLNNFMVYLPGLIFISAIWEAQNDLSHQEPVRMWWRKEVIDLSFEDRPGERARELALIQKEEAKINPEKRDFAINMRLGNFAPTGYYTGDDLTVLNRSYDEIFEPGFWEKTMSYLGFSSSPSAPSAEQDRFLAGLMYDPGFNWMVHQDPDVLARFNRDIQTNWNDIQALYAERGIDSQAMWDTWFNP